MKNLRGATLLQILSAGSERSRGIEMPGVAGEVWEYEDVLLEFGDSILIRFNPGGVEVVESLPAQTKEIQVVDDDGNPCIGCEVADLFDDRDGGLFLAFSDGRYFEHSCQPGGSYLAVGRFSDWDSDEEMDEMVSLLPGNTATAAPLTTRAEPQR